MQIQPGEDQNSLRERRKNHVTEYMDSILNTNHASLVIGNIVRSTQFYVGDSITAVFIQKLTPELRNSSEIALLEKGFKRKEKISREKAFENFSMKDANGKTFTLSSLAGKKAILVDMWASSCGPCRAEHPLLKKWYQKYADKGLEIVSVSIDDDKGQWLNAMKDDGIQQWINVCDTSSWESDLVKHYYIPYIPFRFLLDGNRNIILVDNKQDSWIREKDIADLLNKQ
jgi:thiol-disulfide isomerase/thioredoxin